MESIEILRQNNFDYNDTLSDIVTKIWYSILGII